MSDNNFEQRCAIKFCFRLGHNATETFAKLQQAYGDKCFVKGPVNRFLASKNIPVAPQPPYSPDLSPCDFFLFPKLKNHLKGHPFETLENIQTAVTEQLKAIPTSEFHQCYEEWKKRLQRCVASEGSYFEGDNVELTATAGSDVVQSGRPIFDDFFQHLWPYIGNNVVFQMVKRL
ncbi:putative transposase [Trichonephila clavipes]|nr:putative transposase [Trichonephila clavipes]